MKLKKKKKLMYSYFKEYTTIKFIIVRELKIGKIDRFFGDFSVIGWSGEEKSMEKSFKKISAKNRRFFGKNRKNFDI